jgi:hypothetical protein
VSIDMERMKDEILRQNEEKRRKIYVEKKWERQGAVEIKKKEETQREV